MVYDLGEFPQIDLNGTSTPQLNSLGGGINPGLTLNEYIYICIYIYIYMKLYIHIHT